MFDWHNMKKYQPFTQECLEMDTSHHFSMMYKYPDMDAPMTYIWPIQAPVFDPKKRIVNPPEEDFNHFPPRLTCDIKPYELGKMMRFATECMKCQPGLKFWVKDRRKTGEILEEIEETIRNSQRDKPQSTAPNAVKILNFNEPCWWNRCGLYFSYIMAIGRNGKWHVRDQYKELISISTVGKFPYFE